MQIIIGLLGIVAGAAITIKSEWLYQNFGAVEWAEAKLGAGGSHTFYKLLGIAIVILSLLILTGMIEGIILGIFAPLFRGVH